MRRCRSPLEDGWLIARHPRERHRACGAPSPAQHEPEHRGRLQQGVRLARPSEDHRWDNPSGLRDLQATREVERRRMQEAEMAKARQELQAKSTWEGVYEQLSRRFSAMTNRSLPQNKARFYAEASASHGGRGAQGAPGSRTTWRAKLRTLSGADLAVLRRAEHPRRWKRSSSARASCSLAERRSSLAPARATAFRCLGAEYPPGYLDDPRNRRNRACLCLRGRPATSSSTARPSSASMASRERRFTTSRPFSITHTHADHVMGMDDLRSICMKTGRAVPVHTLPRYQDDIRRIFAYAFAEFPEGRLRAALRPHSTCPEESSRRSRLAD